MAHLETNGRFVRRAALSLVCVLAAGVATMARPSVAEACGGTFCDGGPPPPPNTPPNPGPQSMPVDQTGENILFVLDGDTVEAHIQIQYDPTSDPDKFAWLVPLPAVPDVGVGSQRLFTNLLEATVPAFGYETDYEDCGWDDGGGGGGGDGCGDGTGGGGDGWDDGGTGTGGAGTGTGGQDPDRPDVVQNTVVGAFDVAVLAGGTADGVMQWLVDHGFEQDEEAIPILQDYLDEGHVFAAFRLTPGSDASEIHPVVIRYPGNEPCIPIRLTRIAAAEEMDIRAFFLTTSRVVPTNYRHVDPNTLELDWTGLGEDYKSMIVRAIDSPGTDGHAFVTEYAGRSDRVGTSDLADARWNTEAFAAAEAVDVVDLLEDQGLAECAPTGCTYSHPLVAGLLAEFLPVPASLDEATFYGCLRCYEGLIDQDAWNAERFAQMLDERVVLPGQHAADLIATWPYLTRLYATLSPHEMTLDPTFAERTDLDDVDLTYELGTMYYPCAGGRQFWVPDVGWVTRGVSEFAWPDIYPDEMPAARRIELFTDDGSMQVLASNEVLISELLARWNAEGVEVPGPGGERSHCGGTGTGWDEDDGAGNPGGEPHGVTPGCNCTAGDGNTGLAWIGLLILLGLGVTRRLG